MASVSLDRKTRWWSVRYLADPVTGRRVKKTLCRHEGPLPRPGKNGKTPVPFPVRKLAEPFEAAERRAKLGHAPAQDGRVDLAKYVEEYLSAYARSHPATTTRGVVVVLRGFVAWCKAHKITTVQGLTPAACRSWLAEQGKTLKRGTVRTRRGVVAPVFAQARRDRVVLENPWEFVRVEGKDRREIPTSWTEGEVERLLAAASGWHRDMILLAVNTGIRVTALLGLRWNDVDWNRGVVRVRASSSKSGRAYEVPMTKAARTVLQMRHGAYKGPDDGLVIESTIPGRPYASQTSYEAIRNAVARAGVPDHGDYNHVLRRTFATLAIDGGKPLPLVSRWLGHSSLRTTQVYLGHRAEDSVRHIEGFSIGSADPAGDPD